MALRNWMPKVKKAKFITHHYSTLNVDSEARIINPSRNWYQFADPERMTGLVSSKHVVYTIRRQQYFKRKHSNVPLKSTICRASYHCCM